MSSIMEIERFRQLKSSEKKRSKCLLVGTDVSKKSSVCCIGSVGEGVFLSKYRVSHDEEGLQRLNDTIKGLKEKHELQDIVIGVEPTGNYHKAFCEYLRKQGHFIVYVSSVAAKNNRTTLFGGRWGKNDPRDAFNVFDLVRQGKTLYYRQEGTESSDVRRYLNIRQKLMKRKSAIKNSIRTQILACHFPELEEIYKEMSDPEFTHFLENCTTADYVGSTDKLFFLLRYTKRTT